MATLDERFYERTIPEHGPSPSPAQAFERLAEAFDQLAQVMEQLRRRARQYDDLQKHIMRTCAGMRRRQLRRNR